MNVRELIEQLQDTFHPDDQVVVDVQIAAVSEQAEPELANGAVPAAGGAKVPAAVIKAGERIQ